MCRLRLLLIRFKILGCIAPGFASRLAFSESVLFPVIGPDEIVAPEGLEAVAHAARPYELFLLLS